MKTSMRSSRPSTLRRPRAKTSREVKHRVQYVASFEGKVGDSPLDVNPQYCCHEAPDFPSAIIANTLTKRLGHRSGSVPRALCE